MARSFGTAEFLYLLKAIPWTLLLSLGALAGGGIVGLLIAILRTSPFRVLRWLATGYIELFQGTPVLMQLFVTYYGLAVLFNIQVDAWPAVLLAFTLYSGAFLGEIWRGSIQAIPRPQWEAAECLSLSFRKQLWYVILPQAARISIPPTVGFAVLLIKSTSIAAIIGFVELTRAGQLMTDATFKPMIVYPTVAALYFLLCWPLSLLAQTLERRIDALLALASISKRFGAHQALDGVSLAVETGEVVAIIGRSGSGKSTLLRCINGLERPDSGTIEFDGKVLVPTPRHLKALRREIGIVFQSYNLFPHLSVERNITLGPTVAKGMKLALARELARRVLRMVDLEDKIAAYPQQLSGGQQQRVAIARALAMEPRLVLFDEITAALDPELIGEVVRVLDRLAQGGMTMVLVTHEMGFARRSADTIVFMHEGRIWEKGAPASLFGAPRTAELASFIDAILSVDTAAKRRLGNPVPDKRPPVTTSRTTAGPTLGRESQQQT